MSFKIATLQSAQLQGMYVYDRTRRMPARVRMFKFGYVLVYVDGQVTYFTRDSSLSLPHVPTKEQFALMTASPAVVAKEFLDRIMFGDETLPDDIKKQLASLGQEEAALAA